MIQKLRNFIVDPVGQLEFEGKRIGVEHLINVVDRQLTKLKWKHIKLTPRTKMSVKRVVTVCYFDVAQEVTKGNFAPEETPATRKYLLNCHKILNYLTTMQELI